MGTNRPQPSPPPQDPTPSPVPPAPAPAPDAPGLYVHVPFCASKCPYCAFASGTRVECAPGWRDAVVAEAARYGTTAGVATATKTAPFAPFDTLYLGGGTPGFVDPDLLAGLLDGLRAVLPFAPSVDSTIEVNPADVTPDRAAAWRTMGLTRASVGVQALDDDELRFLGRRHDTNGARRAVDVLRAAGFDDLGIDLIYGLPGQTRASWARTLRDALDLQPTHVSCYALTLESCTPLSRAVRLGLVALPGEDLVADLFLDGSQFLRGRGFVHYEVSNFALGDRYRARHNGKYWRHVPTLGLGPSAHSFDGVQRWWNVRGIDAYLRRAASRRTPVAGREHLADDMRRLEDLALGFRTIEGVPLALLGNGPKVQSALARLVADDRIRIANGRVLPTPRGLLVADGLARTFA